MMPSITEVTAEKPCVILTLGVGYIWDVETDLTSRFNCTTVMFDPTPGAGLGQPRKDVPGGYRAQYDRSRQHRPFGVWMEHTGINTKDKLAIMRNSQQFGNDKQTRVKFLTIASMLKKIGLEGGRDVALLKVDVEGYEFGVIDQLVAQRFPYVNLDFHTWDHIKLSAAMHSFANAGYRVVDIDLAQLDNRPPYGMLVHMEFALLRHSSVGGEMRWWEWTAAAIWSVIVTNSVFAFGVGLLLLGSAIKVSYM